MGVLEIDPRLGGQDEGVGAARRQHRGTSVEAGRGDQCADLRHDGSQRPLPTLRRILTPHDVGELVVRERPPLDREGDERDPPLVPGKVRVDEGPGGTVHPDPPGEVHACQGLSNDLPMVGT